MIFVTYSLSPVQIQVYLKTVSLTALNGVLTVNKSSLWIFVFAAVLTVATDAAEGDVD